VATTNELVTRLSSVPMFSGCTKKDLQAIAKTIREIDHPAGTVIATEGEPGAGLFVIDEGDCDVTIGGKRVNQLHAGDFFGEMALLDGGPRTATVTATTDIKLYALTEWVFRGLLVEHPTIAMRTLEAMASRLRNSTKSSTS
jgi:CRP/FNR family cyclic AMP-dependent transcriptional regulator